MICRKQGRNPVVTIKEGYVNLLPLDPVEVKKYNLSEALLIILWSATSLCFPLLPLPMGANRAPEPLTFGKVGGWLTDGCKVEVVAVE